MRRKARRAVRRLVQHYVPCEARQAKTRRRLESDEDGDEDVGSEAKRRMRRRAKRLECRFGADLQQIEFSGDRQTLAVVSCKQMPANAFGLKLRPASLDSARRLTNLSRAFVATAARLPRRT